MKYQIIGDNLGLQINVRQKTQEIFNKVFHWFNVFAVKNVVSGKHLPKKHSRKLIDVPIRELPTVHNVLSLKKDYSYLVSKILVEHITCLKPLEKIVPYHKPHKFSTEMKKVSEEISSIKM